ncbi:hypothetical protein [Zunongwangia sp. HGR-M22]|uniref:hypothetical protein n=1 Tax=Zunongwangia sp. HGR-M22 TaxID=3015168 RepID=UPI0022DD4BA3|nr:hypothetical protein [Zunongwangia sp. HGR-M22]WBL24925.1 hypothetical protein PBT91_13565 [Zunongwangia sp. HGR-M22]
MKNINYIVLAIFGLLLASCQDEYSFPEVALEGDQLNFMVTQANGNDNEIHLRSMESNFISYWSYTDSEGNEIGTSNEDSLSITLPFAGTYNVYYTAYTKGGPVEADPVNVEVSSNDEEYFSADEWAMLTNGVEGKTWVLDMASPIGWAGLDYPHNESGADYWNWFPDYAGNEWVMENKDWGEISFNLDGGYNVSVTQTALNSDSQTSSAGTFNYNIDNHRIRFNGGVELLYGGDYYGDVSNWTSVNVVEISNNSLRLSVVRDQSRTGEGMAQIVFHYRPKE